MVVGVVVMVAVAAIDYRRYRDWAPVIYGLCILMLLAVYAVGHKSRGAQAWFQVGSLPAGAVRVRQDRADRRPGQLLRRGQGPAQGPAA